MKSLNDKHKVPNIGKFPKDWDVCRIGDLVKDKKGAMKIGPFGSQLKKEEMTAGGVKVYGQENIYKRNFNIGTYYISDEKFRLLKSVELFPKDVVITMMGTIGDCCVVPIEIEKGIMDSHLMRIQPNDSILPEFMARMIKDSNLVKKQIIRLSQGAIMSGLNLSLIRDVVIPIPSIKEQRQINKILSNVDDAIEKTDAIIKETQQLKKGLMEKLFKLDNFPLKPLSQLTEEDRPITYGVVKPGNLDKNGVLFIRSGDIQNGKIMIKNLRTISKSISSVYKRTILKGGEILISLVGYPGEVAIVPNELIGANIARQAGMIALKDKDTIPFIMYYLMSPIGKSKLLFEQIGSAQQVINLADLKKIKIPIVPKSMQNKIVSIIKEVDVKIENEQSYKSELQQLMQGLLQVLLTGKVRVKV